MLAALANPAGHQKLVAEAGYFSNNHERMQYLDFH